MLFASTDLVKVRKKATKYMTPEIPERLEF